MKKLFSILLTCVAMLSIVSSANAAEAGVEPGESPFRIDFEDSATKDAIILSEETTVENGRLTTVTKFLTKDGRLIIDTFERSALAPLSENGTDSATRTRDLGDGVTVTVTGNFKWYTDKSAGIPGIGISYVKCTSMSASYTLGPGYYTCTKWEKYHTSEYKAFGTARAGVDFTFINGRQPALGATGNVQVFCDDKGSISDNIPSS